MYNVTNRFKEYIKKPSRGFKSKVIIRDKEYLDDVIIEMSQEETVNPGDDFTLGSVASASFEISLHDVDDIFQNAIVKPYLGLEIEGEVEYIPLGVFTVDDVKKQNKTVKLSCFDNMIKMEKAYFSDLKYPCNINEVLKEICKKANITCPSILPNYSIGKIEGYSLRESIGFIASICGGFARFDREGQLEITSYINTDITITPDNYITFETGDKEYKISKVTATKGEQHLSKGNETEFGREIIFDNPVITDSILNDIYNKYKGFSYMPYELKWQGNCSLMAGDRVKIVDLKGKEYNTLIMQQKLNYKGGLSSEIKAIGKSEQSNKFDSKGSVTQKLERYSIEQASIRKALIEKANIIDLEAINSKIENLYAEDLTAINGEIKNLKSEKADITQLNAQGAKIEDLYATKATIIDLEANKGKITILESRAASIENLLAGNIGAENIKAGTITAASGIISDGAIGDAQISSLSATKLTAGVIDAAVITVKNLTADNIKAKSINGKVLEDGAVDDSKVADNANIAGSKLNIDDVVVNINKSNTNISSTKINVGNKTLDIELKDQNINIEKNNTDIHSQKLKINALEESLKVKIDKQEYIKDKQEIENNVLQVNTYMNKQSTELQLLQNEIKSKVGQTEIDKAILETDDKVKTINQKIESANSEINQVKNKLDLKVETSDFQSFKTDISSEVSSTKSKLSTSEQSINMLKGEISSKVSKTDIEKKIVEVSETNRNLIINSGRIKDLLYWSTLYGGGADKIGLWVQDGMFGKGAGTKTTLVNNGWAIMHNDSLTQKGFKFNVGEKYTLSGKIWSLNDNARVRIQICDDNSTNEVVKQDYTLSSGYTNFVISFTANITGNENKVRFNIASDNTGIFVPFVKLNEGEKATKWTPAPEDVTVENTTKINSSVSEIKQLSNQIKSKVDVNGIKSFVEQNPSSVKIGFNAITPNVNLSNSGTFEIINGALHVKNNNAEVVIDGKYNMHKIVVTGTIKMYCPWNQESTMLKINHGLGYVPAYSIYYRKHGGQVVEPLPSVSITSAVPGSVFGFDMLIRSQADDTGIQIVAVRTKERADRQNESLELRYFIYKEVAF